MHVRVGQHSVTLDKHWSFWDDVPAWRPGVEWTWADYEVDESSRVVLMTYSNPTDRYWEFFHLPGDQVALWSRLERAGGRADDEFVGVWHVREV